MKGDYKSDQLVMKFAPGADGSVARPYKSQHYVKKTSSQPQVFYFECTEVEHIKKSS